MLRKKEEGFTLLIGPIGCFHYHSCMSSLTNMQSKNNILQYRLLAKTHEKGWESSFLTGSNNASIVAIYLGIALHHTLCLLTKKNQFIRVIQMGIKWLRCRLSSGIEAPPKCTAGNASAWAGKNTREITVNRNEHHLVPILFIFFK